MTPDFITWHEERYGHILDPNGLECQEEWAIWQAAAKAEREACAGIAENFEIRMVGGWYKLDQDGQIAQAIRERGSGDT